MEIIRLTQGQEAWISDEDYERVSKHKWYACKTRGAFYAMSYIDGKHISLHRFILNTPDGMDVDHIDHNTLDNRRFNIRNCTHIENLQNQRSFRNSTSKYKGISWHEKTKKWQVSIRTGGKDKYLGLFDNEHDAARAYNVAAKKYFGDFARLNVITESGKNYQLFGA